VSKISDPNYIYSHFLTLRASLICRIPKQNHGWDMLVCVRQRIVKTHKFCEIWCLLRKKRKNRGNLKKHGQIKFKKSTNVRLCRYHSTYIWHLSCSLSIRIKIWPNSYVFPLKPNQWKNYLIFLKIHSYKSKGVTNFM
jgi:hypothetical protein